MAVSCPAPPVRQANSACLGATLLTWPPGNESVHRTLSFTWETAKFAHDVTDVFVSMSRENYREAWISGMLWGQNRCSEQNYQV